MKKIFPAIYFNNYSHFYGLTAAARKFLRDEVKVKKVNCLDFTIERISFLFRLEELFILVKKYNNDSEMDEEEFFSKSRELIEKIESAESVNFGE